MFPKGLDHTNCDPLTFRLSPSSDHNFNLSSWFTTKYFQNWYLSHQPQPYMVSNFYSSYKQRWVLLCCALWEAPALYLRFVHSNPQRSFESQGQQLNIGLWPLSSQASEFSTIIFTVLLGCIPAHLLRNNLDRVIKYSDIVSRSCWFRRVWERRVCVGWEIAGI